MNSAYNPSDALIAFINSDYSNESCYQLLNEVGYSNVSCVLVPCTATHAVLVDKTTNYSFTSVEIEWLHSVNCISEYNVGDVYTVVISEMNCTIDDYYIFCAAIIKIFETAFAHNSLYIFKINDSVAFGCLRDFSRTVPNNYIISKLLNGDNIYDFSDFIEELFAEDMDNIPLLISDFSPLNSYENDDYYKSYSDRIYDENEYINALLEIQSFYGVDTSKERERSALILEGNNTVNMNIDCSELKTVANEANQKTSYEELVIATSANEHAFVNTDNEEIQLSFFDENLPSVSDAAYTDAEKMLKELLGK